MTTKNKVIYKTSADLAESLGLNPSVSVEWEVRSSVTKKIIVECGREIGRQHT